MNLVVYENYRDLFPELAGHALTDALILKAVEESGIDTARLHIIRDHRGKPFVAPRSTVKIHVSASHCLGTFACIVSDQNCGIDIQEPRNTNVLKIARRYFTDDEIDLVTFYGSEMFYKLWTRKEAFAKYTGNGIADVIRKTQVLSREDVTFQDSVMENGMYLCICTPR